MSFIKHIAGIVQELQQRTADTLGRRINRYSLRQKKIGFFAIGFMIGTFCFFLVIGTIGNDHSSKALQIDTITMPKDITTFKWDSLKQVPPYVLDSLKSFLKTFKY